MSSLWQDLMLLFFPELCCSCHSQLTKSERNICLYCLCNLPSTDFHEVQNNKTEKLLWGRVEFSAATSLLYFSKLGITQRLIHHLKYKQRGDLGVELGEILGKAVLNNTRFEQVDLLVPVPIHPNKLAVRGYNQSEQIALGMAEVLNIEISSDNLVRENNRKSQTKKSRIDRANGLKEDFRVLFPEKFKGRNVLLIDDVITTGSTLEACSAQLNKCDLASLCIATIGIPVN